MCENCGINKDLYLYYKKYFDNEKEKREKAREKRKIIYTLKTKGYIIYPQSVQ